MVDIRTGEDILNDIEFLRMTRGLAYQSPDPATRVGAMIVSGPEHFVSEYNHTPRALPRNLATLPRHEKLQVTVHAEMAALATAARIGMKTKHATIYVVALDVETKIFWGSAPCCHCTKSLLMAGIKRVVTVQSDFKNQRWQVDTNKAREWLAEANVEYVEIPIDHL